MDIIIRIIDAVADIHGIKRNNVLSSTHKQTFSARQMLCYFVIEYYPKEVPNLIRILRADMDMCSVFRSTFIKRMVSDTSLAGTIKQLEEDVKMRNTIARLEEQRQKRDKELHKRNKLSRRLFNIEYTYEDEMNRICAMQESVKFMKKHCKTGRQPIEEGMVFPK